MPVALAWAGLFVIKALYTDNLLAFALLFLVTGATLWYRRSCFKLFYVFFAMALGIFGEWLCTRADLWVYANPSWIRLPAWLPLAWAVSMMNFYEVAAWFSECLEKTGPIIRQALVWTARLLILAYLVFMALKLHNTVAWVLIGFFLFAAVLARKPFHTLLFLVSATGGFWGEYLLVQAGVWHYTRPMLSTLGMPISLPIAWGLSAVLIWLAARACMGLVPGSGSPAQPADRPE